VFLTLHGDDLSEAFQQVNAARAGRGLKAETMMYAEDEVEIVLQCSPVGAYDDIKKLFDDSVITDKVFRKHAADIFSLTEEELEKGHIERPPVAPLKPPPLKKPAPKKIKT
jgi:hypothetical protein